MRVQITIGDETLTYAQASKDWINKSFAHAKQEGYVPCVRVQILEPGIAMGLITPNCASVGGGGGTLSAAQKEIHEAWIRHHLSSTHYTGGNLIAFLNELERLVS